MILLPFLLLRDIALAVESRQTPVHKGFMTTSAPIVHTLNGTYAGKYLPSFNQDVFLGMPYAQPPIGDLRFRWPRELNSSWPGVRQAMEYGASCYQYNTRTDLSEDCLTINVIRPTGVDVKAALPVFVSIYGGGFTQGSVADPSYNLSGLVAVSQRLSQPMIAVAMNYRLGLWGFLSSPETMAEGNTNAGLMDQRLAFRWIQENIGAFGGDPKRVTLWGHSAGAQAIALHLNSFGGRDDGLFHAAILESGGPVGTAMQELAYYDKPFAKLTAMHGCNTTTDRLTCLRAVPEKNLFLERNTKLWNPLVDGRFLTDWPSTLMQKGQFIKIPLITGANSDEGVSFGNRKIEDDVQLANWLKSWRAYNLSSSSIERLITLYDKYDYPPYGMASTVQLEGYEKKGRKSGAIGGDLVMIAQRRKVAQVYTKVGQKVWSYRFDTPLWNAKPSDGSRHSAEMVFSFQNITGMLGPLPAFQHHRRMSEAIGAAYVNFVNRWDPNTIGNASESTLPQWPSYAENPANMVFNASNIHVEKDDWREEGMAFINSISRELLS